MTYIYDMASGTEYPGEALLRPRQTAISNPAAPHTLRAEHRAELQLTLVQNDSDRSPAPKFPGHMDLVALFDAVDN
jgi:hypothetical protein